ELDLGAEEAQLLERDLEVGRRRTVALLEGGHDLVARNAEMIEEDAGLGAGAVERQDQRESRGGERAGGDLGGVRPIGVAGDGVLEELDDEVDARDASVGAGAAERQGAEVGAPVGKERVEGGLAVAEPAVAEEGEEVGEVGALAEPRRAGGARRRAATAGGGARDGGDRRLVQRRALVGVAREGAERDAGGGREDALGSLGADRAPRRRNDGADEAVV